MSFLVQVKPRSEKERDRRNRIYQSRDRPVASCKMAYDQFRLPPPEPIEFRKRYAERKMLPPKQMRQSKTTSKIRSCRSVKRKFGKAAATGSDVVLEPGAGAVSRLRAVAGATRGCSSL